MAYHTNCQLSSKHVHVLENNEQVSALETVWRAFDLDLHLI